MRNAYIYKERAVYRTARLSDKNKYSLLSRYSLDTFFSPIKYNLRLYSTVVCYLLYVFQFFSFKDLVDIRFCVVQFSRPILLFPEFFSFWRDRRMHNLCVARNPNGERNGIYQCLTFYLHFLNNESQDVRTVHSSINNDLPFQFCIWKSGHHKQIRVRRKSTRYSLHSIFSEIIRVGGGEGHTSETQE